MPYSYDPNQDPENNQNGGGQNQQAPQLAGSGQVVGGASSTQANAPAGDAAPQSKGGNTYQNLNAYLDANSGNGFGEQFAGKVNSDVNAATSAQDQGAQMFQGASDAGAVKPNQSLVDQALANPTGAVADPTQLSLFQAQKNAQYQGPQSYADDGAAYQTAYGATQKASDTAGAAGSEGGRFALLNNYFGNPNYTQGQKGLDNLLIAGNQNAQQGIQQAQQNANAAQVRFQGQGADMSNYAAGNAAQTEQAAKYANTQGTNAVNAATTAQQTQLAKDVADQQAAWQAAQQGLSSKDTSGYGGLLQPFGVQQGAAWQSPDWSGTKLTEATPGHDTGYYGLDPSQFLQQGGQPTLSSATSPAEQAKLQALQQLMGQNQTQYDSTQGQYDPSKPYGFDTKNYNDALTAAQQSYAAQEAAIHNNIQSILSKPIVAGMPMDPGQTISPQNVYAKQIQDQVDRLNSIRGQFGLGAVTNPYINNPAPFGTKPPAPVL